MDVTKFINKFDVARNETHVFLRI